MKKHFAIAAAAILLAACASKQQSPAEIMTKVKDNYERHSSVAYQVDYRIKYISEPDTFSLKALCKLLRDTTDKLIGGHVWILANDSIETYYNQSRMYSVDRAEKKIIDCEGNEENAGFITSSRAGDAKDIGFLQPAKTLARIKDTANKVSLAFDKGHFIIGIKYPDEEGCSEQEHKYWVKEGDYVIDRITYRMKFQGNYQYSECIISDMEFDKVSVADLDRSMEVYKKTYTPQPYPPKEVPILEAGVTAPFFTGTHFQTGRDVSLMDYKGKWLILDFSYMGCYPCIMAIPHLNKIQKEYGDKVAVLGLNSKETEEKYKKPLRDFITHNAISYPLILTSGKTDSLYQVTGYPTLYVLDKKGKIAYAALGFSETLEDSIKTVLNRGIEEEERASGKNLNSKSRRVIR